MVIKRLRQPKQLAWLNALVTPINQLHTIFLYYRANVIYRINITPQICYLEQLLNDRFDIQQRRIRIRKPVAREPLVLFQKVENKPVALFTKAEDQHQVLWQRAESQMFTVDFIVEVPVFVSFDLAELTEMVNTYKLLSKTFKVQIV